MNLIKTLFVLGSICLSLNLNAQWTMCNTPSGALPFSLEIQNDTIYMGTVGNGIYRSIDRGANWTQINNGITSMQIWTINHTNNALYASSTGGAVFRSTNGGENWVLSNTGVSPTTIVRKFVSFNGQIFASTSNTGVIISGDNGSSWSQNNSGITGLVSEALMVVENDLYLGVNQKVYKYDIVNQNWVSKSNGVPNNTVGSLTYVKDDLQNIILFEGNGNSNDVVKSTNGGDSWSITDNGLPNVGVYSLLGISTTVFAGNDYGVYQTSNQGESWIDISGFEGASPAKFLTKSSDDLYVLQGGKLWKKDLASLGITSISDVITYPETRVFPNPTNNTVFIDRMLPVSNYEIIDITGKVVATGLLYNQSIDLTGLKNGLYLISLSPSDNNKIYLKVLKN